MQSTRRSAASVPNAHAQPRRAGPEHRPADLRRVPGPAQRIEPPTAYHTPPGDIGRAAEAAGAFRLLVSHLMPPYVPAKIERIEAAVRERYDGEVLVAEDLMTLEARGSPTPCGTMRQVSDRGCANGFVSARDSERKTCKATTDQRLKQARRIVAQGVQM